MTTPLSRRTLLRGAGAAVALPLLDAMLPRSARAVDAAPRHILLWFTPNGYPEDRWHPTTTGPLWTETPSLAPLRAHRPDLTVLRGVHNVPGAPTHELRCRSLVSERLPDGPYGLRFGASLDHRLAALVGPDLPFPTLPLASEGATACASGSCHWLYHLSWTSELQSEPALVHPRVVMQRLFGTPDAAGDEAAARRYARRASVLDAVLDDASALRATLGGEDRARVDAWLDAVRAVERRLQAPAHPDPTCAAGALLPQPADATDHVEQMLDLATLALTCGQTRVVTYMLGVAESYRGLAFLGLPGDHHSASHFDPTTHEAVCAWASARFAGLLDRLAAHTLPTGRRLLDDTLVLHLSEIGTGATHTHQHLPVLVAGGGQGGDARDLGGVPLARLLVDVLAWAGEPAATFGREGTLGGTGGASGVV